MAAAIPGTGDVLSLNTRNLDLRVQRIIGARLVLRMLPIFRDWSPAVSDKKLDRREGYLAVFRAMFALLAIFRLPLGLSAVDHDIAKEIIRGLRSWSSASLMSSAGIRDTLAALIVSLETVLDDNVDRDSLAFIIEYVMRRSVQDTQALQDFRKTLINEAEADLLCAVDRGVQLLDLPLWHAGEPLGAQRDKASIFGTLVSSNPSFSVWRDWYEHQILGNRLQPDVLGRVFRLPKEVLAQDVTSINRRIGNILAGLARRPLNRARAIFIGHGAAGKTSLIRALHGERVEAGSGDMTRGLNVKETTADDNLPNVDIRETSDSSRDLTVHFWDFGGQVVVHQTHQFFLRSNCLYVLVLDGRQNEKINDDARYWLEHIRAYGGNAPVLIVGNKIDISPAHVDLTSLRRYFPNVLDFYPLSCVEATDAYAAEFNRFSRDFYNILSGPTLTRQTMLTDGEFCIMEEVRTLAREHFSFDRSRFSSMFSARMGDDPGEVTEESLLDLFDKLGIIIRFPDIDEHGDVLTNPEWLTRGVFEIMYNKDIIRSGGVTSPREILEILSASIILDQRGRRLVYDEYRSQFIIRAMEKFKLLFPMKYGVKFVVIPSLLGAIQPPTNFDFGTAIAFRYRFEGFMPPHILPQLIVERGNEISGKEFWQFGARFQSNIFKAEAYVHRDDHTRCITLHVGGVDANEYFPLLKQTIEESFAALDHLHVHEEVQLTGDMRYRRHEARLSQASSSTWESYRQVKGALKYPSHPFIGSDGLEYDLRRVHQALPVTTFAERALQVVDAARSDADEVVGLPELSKDLIEVRSAIVEHDATPVDSSGDIRERLGSAARKVEQHLARADKASGNVEGLVSKLIKIGELLSRLL